MLSRIGKSTNIDPNRSLLQFYKKEGGEFIAKKYKTASGYNVLMTKSKNLEEHYKVPCIERIEKETMQVRELLVANFISKIMIDASNISVRSLLPSLILCYIGMN